MYIFYHSFLTKKHPYFVPKYYLILLFCFITSIGLTALVRDQNNFDAIGTRLTSFDGIPAEDVIVKLFDNISYTINFQETTTFSNGSFAWIGKIQDQPMSSVVFANTKGIWHGQVQDENGSRFMIVSTRESNIYSILQLGDQIMDEGNDQVIIPEEELDNSRNVVGICDAGSICPAVTVDLLVVYTTDVKNNNGGTAPVEAGIAAAVADLNNVVNPNSGVIHSFNLRHVEEINS